MVLDLSILAPRRHRLGSRGWTPPQLTTGSGYVASPRPADRSGLARSVEHCRKAVDRRLGRTAQLGEVLGILVEGDDVDLGGDAVEELGDGSCVLCRVVETVDQDVLEGDATTSFQREEAQSLAVLFAELQGVSGWGVGWGRNSAMSGRPEPPGGHCQGAGKGLLNDPGIVARTIRDRVHYLISAIFIDSTRSPVTRRAK